MTIAAFSFGLGAHLAAFAFVGLQACAGARLLGWLGVRDVRSHERLLFQGVGMKLFDIREAGTDPQ